MPLIAGASRVAAVAGAANDDHSGKRQLVAPAEVRTGAQINK